MGTGSRDGLQGSVVVFDRTGEVFARLRRAALGVALWRARESEALPEGARLAITAGPAVGWDRVSALVAQVPTLVIAAQATDSDALHALTLGAMGYLSITMPRASLRRAVLAALAGELVFSRRTLAARVRATGARSTRPMPALTKRQREVLALIARGAGDKEIGARLGISPATVQKHAAGLVKRLGVPNRAAAASAYGGAEA